MSNLIWQIIYFKFVNYWFPVTSGLGIKLIIKFRIMWRIVSSGVCNIWTIVTPTVSIWRIVTLIRFGVTILYILLNLLMIINSYNITIHWIPVITGHTFKNVAGSRKLCTKYLWRVIYTRVNASHLHCNHLGYNGVYEVISGQTKSLLWWTWSYLYLC